MKPDFKIEGDDLVLLDTDGNQIGDAYPLSPIQNPKEVAEWLREWRAQRPLEK